MKGAFSSNGHLAFAGKSNLFKRPNLNLSIPAHAIIAALSLHKFAGGKTGSKSFWIERLINFFLILLLEATPSAITKVFFFINNKDS